MRTLITLSTLTCIALPTLVLLRSLDRTMERAVHLGLRMDAGDVP